MSKVTKTGLNWRPIASYPKESRPNALFKWPDNVLTSGKWYSSRPNVPGYWAPDAVSQHGCGCCSDESDQPIEWVPIEEALF